MTKLIKAGSVKNIYEDSEGVFFTFSDRYSIFDWGEMPDGIRDKGKNLSEIAAFFFNWLDQHKIKHHLKNYIDNKFYIERFSVAKKGTAGLIPLEVIFRHGVPKGSSLIKKGFKEGEEFSAPRVDFTTKLEALDLVLTPEEALEASTLSSEEFKELTSLTIKLSLLLKDFFNKKGVKLWDGKFEFAINKKREILLIDSIGPDELRLEKAGVLLSKENLRDFYRHTDFYQKLIVEKKKQGTNFSKDRCPFVPHNLPIESLNHISKMYTLLKEIILSDRPEGIESWIDLQKNYQDKKNILVVGDGGREHMIALKLTHSPLVQKVIILTKKANIYQNTQIETLWNEDIFALISTQDIDLVVIGPEAPLVSGMADQLRTRGVDVFGPGASGSKLEASKSFSKMVMMEAGIPCAQSYETQNAKTALKFIEDPIFDEGCALKASGLAAGKGVIVTNSREEAKKKIKEIIELDSLGIKESTWLLEEKLVGPETSLFALFDERTWRFLGSACDYKRIRNNDEGPNTGGMGTYSPGDYIDAGETQKMAKTVFQPLHDELKKRKVPFNGVVFAGLMLTQTGAKCLEFNVRFGDPETQTLLPRIKNDLYLLFKSVAQNRLSETDPIQLSNDFYVHVVKAAYGYPGTEGIEVQKGDEITVRPFKNPKEAFATFAGVNQEGQRLMTAGGRVLGVTAKGKNKSEARKLAYENLKSFSFTGEQFRDDIAK